MADLNTDALIDEANKLLILAKDNPELVRKGDIMCIYTDKPNYPLNIHSLTECNCLSPDYHSQFDTLKICYGCFTLSRVPSNNHSIEPLQYKAFPAYCPDCKKPFSTRGK